MNCLIVDDNPLAIEIIRHLINQIKDLNLVGECTSPAAAKNFLKENSVDLILLDVEMPEMNGFEFLKTLDQRPLVIMISGHEKYALKGFEVNVADYLVKPLQEDRFKNSIKRVREMLDAKTQKLDVKNKDMVFVKDNSVLKKLNFSEIQWVEAQGDYAKIQTPEKFYMVHTTLKTLENKLPPEIFLRVHRSFIIPLNKIDQIEENIIYINKKAIPVSDNYWPGLKTRLQLL